MTQNRKDHHHSALLAHMRQRGRQHLSYRYPAPTGQGSRGTPPPPHRNHQRRLPQPTPPNFTNRRSPSPRRSSVRGPYHPSRG